jgi:hypothetical protein
MDRRPPPARFLSSRRAVEFADGHIPYRVFFLEAGILACQIINSGSADKPGDLSVGNIFTFRDIGVRTFTNYATESAIMYCRVLLNFLGIYKRQNRPILESRGPLEHFRSSEVWIERFRGGVLLPIRDICQDPLGHNSPKRMYWHIVRTLEAANRGVAHLTVPKMTRKSIGGLRIDSLYYTSISTWTQMALHFYRDTMKSDVPPGMAQFRDSVLKKPSQDS